LSLFSYNWEFPTRKAVIAIAKTHRKKEGL